MTAFLEISSLRIVLNWKYFVPELIVTIGPSATFWLGYDPVRLDGYIWGHNNFYFARGGYGFMYQIE